MDGGLLPGRALRLFCGKPLQEVQEITFEIGMLGKYGLDIHDCRSSPVLQSRLGWAFSALQMVLTCHKQSNGGFSQ